MALKLYDLPKGAVIKEPWFSENGKKGDTIIFDHIDGMYSYCRTMNGNKDMGVVHLSASTPMKKVGNHYIINKN